MDVDFALILMTRDTQHTLTKVTSSKLRNTYFSYICFFTRREVKLKNLMTHSRESESQQIILPVQPQTLITFHFLNHTAHTTTSCALLGARNSSYFDEKKKFLCQQSHKNRHKFSFLTSHQRIQNFNLFLLSFAERLFRNSF